MIYRCTTSGLQRRGYIVSINPPEHLLSYMDIYDGGFIDSYVPIVPKPIRGFIEEYTRYATNVPEDPGVTKKIFRCPMILAVGHDKNFLGAIFSIDIDRKNYEVEFRILVSEQHRKKGVGSSLVEVIKDSYRGYCLVCEFSNFNEVAKKFFIKHGFVLEEDKFLCKAIYHNEK